MSINQPMNARVVSRKNPAIYNNKEYTTDLKFEASNETATYLFGLCDLRRSDEKWHYATP